MSLGFEIMSGFENDQITLMDEAFARAFKANTTVCAASGNEYTDTSKSYPASSPWTDRQLDHLSQMQKVT